jgi:hypothetical protein
MMAHEARDIGIVLHQKYRGSHTGIVWESQAESPPSS